MPKKRTRQRPAAQPAALELLPSGVPGLDEVLGGGLPALSFNLIAGGPGSGKTTLAMQIVFANAAEGRPGLFFTLLGETTLKMLRYQQQFAFFDLERIGKDVHFLNLSDEVLDGGLDEVLTRMIAEVKRVEPAFVVVDSFRSLVRAQQSATTERQLEYFVQRLALHLTTWDITSFLIGEYESEEVRNPVFTVADDIFWLSQATDRNSVVRKLQIVKARGMNSMPGLHTIRMSGEGIQVFPRIAKRELAKGGRKSGKRLSTGIVGLDEMMGGGITAGDSLVLAGPSGTGKTTFALQFVAAGLRAGETAVIAVFEEHPMVYLERARAAETAFMKADREGRLRILYLRPLDLSVDETLHEIQRMVAEIGATRLVIDSISGFEIALAPTFREDFRESLYRLIGTLTGGGVTIYSTVEVLESASEWQLTGRQISFLTDDILSQRYVEIDGEMRKVLTVVKMRGSAHSTEFREYQLTGSGVLLREPMSQFDGLHTGAPTRQLRLTPKTRIGLTQEEVILLDMIVRAGVLSAEQIGARSGLAPGLVSAGLERLLSLRYVSQDGDLFRGIAQGPGS
jgi:circadian clock protein KaiC